MEVETQNLFILSTIQAQILFSTATGAECGHLSPNAPGMEPVCFYLSEAIRRIKQIHSS